MRTRGSHVLIFVLIVAGVAGAIAAGDPTPPQRTLPPLPARAMSARMKSLRERAMETASRTRGLGWRGEVGMTELSGWEYGTRTKEIADVLATDDLKPLSRLAAAGGTLPDGTAPA